MALTRDEILAQLGAHEITSKEAGELLDTLPRLPCRWRGGDLLALPPRTWRLKMKATRNLGGEVILDLEDTLRRETTCRGCGKPKAVGDVVCWPCFKGRTDIVPLKWFDGTLEQWLATAQPASRITLRWPTPDGIHEETIDVTPVE